MPDKKRVSDREISVKSLARGYTKTAINRLGSIMENSPDEGTSVAAAKVLLDRGWGRPKVKETKEHKGSVKIVLRHIRGDET